MGKKSKEFSDSSNTFTKAVYKDLGEAIINRVKYLIEKGVICYPATHTTKELRFYVKPKL